MENADKQEAALSKLALPSLCRISAKAKDSPILKAWLLFHTEPLYLNANEVV